MTCGQIVQLAETFLLYALILLVLAGYFGVLQERGWSG